MSDQSDPKLPTPPVPQVPPSDHAATMATNFLKPAAAPMPPADAQDLQATLPVADFGKGSLPIPGERRGEEGRGTAETRFPGAVADDPRVTMGTRPPTEAVRRAPAGPPLTPAEAQDLMETQMTRPPTEAVRGAPPGAPPTPPVPHADAHDLMATQMTRPPTEAVRRAPPAPTAPPADAHDLMQTQMTRPPTEAVRRTPPAPQPDAQDLMATQTTRPPTEAVRRAPPQPDAQDLIATQGTRPPTAVVTKGETKMATTVVAKPAPGVIAPPPTGQRMPTLDPNETVMTDLHIAGAAAKAASGDTQDRAATAAGTAWDERNTAAATRIASNFAPAKPGPQATPVEKDRTFAANFGTSSTPASQLADTVVTARGVNPGTTPSASGSAMGTGAPSTQALTRSGSFTRTNLRTRINTRLPADTQQLDAKLQLSRGSVLADMVTARIARGDSSAVPPGLTRRIAEQGTEARYAIDKPLAAGGMGAVLAIEDHDFHRAAAMKVIHAKFTANPEALERFLAEAQVTAQLEHPNIVPIHDLGVMEDGTLYFTMKLIEGQSLGTVIKTLKAGEPAALKRWTIEEKILTFLKVLDGVGFANAKGVVHRDIKPDNIMLGLHGEVLVVDWGIAKVIGQADGGSVKSGKREVASVRDQDGLSMTMEGAAMGTIFYMPPEQAAGRLDEIDARSDVYALGATLYELLSLKRTLEGNSLPDLIGKITTGNTIGLDKAMPTLHPDLIAVVHRSMALDRANRYATCADFADDLRRYLAGRAVLARTRNLIERIGMWYQAHRLQVNIGAGAVALVAVAVVGTTWVIRGENRARAAEQFAAAQRLYDQAKPTLAETGLKEAKHDITGALELARGDALMQALDASIDSALEQVEVQKKKDAQERANSENAAKLLVEAKHQKSLNNLKEAKAQIDAAFQLTPKNAEIDNFRTDLQNLLSNEIKRENREAAQGHFNEGASLLAEARKLPLTDPSLVPRIQKAEAAFTLSTKDGELIQGTTELAKEAALLRVKSADAVQQAKLAASSQAATAEARQALAAHDYAKAKDAVARAIGFVPGDAAAQQLKIDILGQEQTALAAAAAADQLRQGQDLTAKAKAAFAAGDLNGARDLIAQAWGHVPGNAEVDTVRQAVAQALKDKAAADARAAVQAQARAGAEKALAEGKTEYGAHVTAVAKKAAATAAIEHLRVELADRGGDAKAPLWQAYRDEREANAASAQAWAQAEASAQNVVTQLRDEPANPSAVAARQLLADLYQERLVETRQANDLPGILAFSNQLARVDDAHRYDRLLSDRGRLVLNGAAGTKVSLVRLGEGPDTRLVPAGQATSLTLPLDGGGLDLDAGHYQLGAGDIIVSFAVSATVPVTVPWPGKLPEVPGIALRYVAGHPSLKPFMLGTTEITHDQYFQFVTDPAVFPKVQAAWKVTQHKNNQADHKLSMLYLPRQTKDSGEYWQAFAEAGEDTTLLQRVELPKDYVGMPVAGVNHADAVAYCAWLSSKTGLKVRLPTLAEWRFAAKGGDSHRRYPWGEIFDESLAVSTRTGNPSHPTRTAAEHVGSKVTDVGPFGNLDLAGNVRELLGDSGGDIGRPLIAGGGWADDKESEFRSDFSDSVDPDFVYPVIGFRILVEFSP